MLMTVRRAGFLAFVALAIAAPARAAGPGDTLLISRPAGNAPITADLFAWNESGVASEQGNGVEQNVTADGRYVVFESLADGLAPGEDPGFSHVFRKDTQTGALTVVDTGADGDSTDPDISNDGRYVVFTSRASNLVPADTTHDPDVFVKDLATGGVTLLTPSTAGTDCLSCLKPVISGDGSEVAFVTLASLVAGDTNGKSDVYAISRGGGTPILVSAKPGGTDASAGTSFEPSITDDGTTVAYLSTGNDLNNANDPTTDRDLYVRVLSAAGSGLASAQSGSNFGTATGGVDDGQISGDGTTVVWSDTASYLVADGDTKDDIYKRVLGNNATDTLISVNTAGTKGDDASFAPAIDSTGRRVAFISAANNLGASHNTGTDLFVRDTTSATTTAITDGTSIETQPQVTHGTGDRVAFQSFKALSDGPSPEAIHVASVGGGGLAIVSQPATGGPLVPRLSSTFSPDFFNTSRRVSADGRYVVFASDAPALGGPVGATECWRRDLHTDELLMVSTGPSGPFSGCDSPTISSDGQRVAFYTADPLDPADSGTSFDAYVHDIPSGTNTLATRADGEAGAPATGSSFFGEISGDGRKVAFESTATNLGDATGHLHIYLRNLDDETTALLDRATNGTIGTAALSDYLSVDETGDRVVFATNDHLDPTIDTDGVPDVYVRDVSAGTTMLVSRQSASDGGAKGATGSLAPIISQDGNHVAFLSTAQNLVPSLAPWPAGPTFELFVRDIAAQTTTMASTSADGISAGDGGVGTFFAVDGNGDEVAYEVSNFPTPSNIAPQLSGDSPAVIARRVSTHQNLAVIQPDPIGGGSQATTGARAPGLSADGRCLSYYENGRNVFPGMSPDFTQLYARVLDGNCQTPPPVGGPGPAAVAPRLSRVSMTNRRFRVGKKRTAVVARKRKRRAKVGTTFRFTLDQAATVTIRIDRLTKGKRVKKRCVAPKAKLRKHKSCVRARKRGTLTRKSLAAGARRVAFSGRIGKRKLPVGSYRATLTATAAGLKSKPVRLRFTVVR